MKKNYIKMNNNKCLSLGNIIKTIKEISNNDSAMQTEIFCCIFNCNGVNATTINNYCIGIRAIGIEYKNYFEEMYKQKKLIGNVLSIVSILDNRIYKISDDSLDLINNNMKFKELVNKLLTIASNDECIDNIDQFQHNNLYDSFIELLYYAIIKNKQPIYTQNINIRYDKNELNEYMKIKLYWGQSNISALINLSNKGNMYACADLGSLEFDGLVDGNVNYDKSYFYYLKAANKSHPKACWMIANLIFTKRVKYDFETMWKYLNKSIELGSAAGYNTMGLCYLNGMTPGGKKDIEKAKYYFNIASELGYVYAFNNLGKIYEEDNPDEAIKYYKISADMNNSWALNKVGEYYREKGDLKLAYICYSKAIECPVNEICKYAYYNLAKYYYENGFSEININKNENLSKQYYDIFNSK